MIECTVAISKKYSNCFYFYIEITMFFEILLRLLEID